MSAPVHLVLGASGGIGSALVRRLAASGAIPVLAGRNAATLGPLAQELGAEHHVLDATDFDAVQACVQAVAQRHERLDGVVNCVGSLLLKPAHQTTAEEWSAVLATNLGSAFATVRAAGRTMRSGGSVVLVASAASEVGLPSHEAIAAAKAGVAGLTRAAAATYASRGLRVNAVAPGMVETPLTASLLANETSAEASRALHPLGRIGQPAEVAAAIAWLLDPVAGWVTGQVVGIDGGLAHVRGRPSTRIQR